MNLGSISENLDVEKRIAISPEMAKKYINLGFNLSLSKNYASHLGFTDADYTNLGANLCDNDEEVIQNSMIITQLGLPNEKNLSLFKENQTLIGSLNSFLNKDKLEKLKLRKVNCFSLEMLQITRHNQWIFIIQANLAG